MTPLAIGLIGICALLLLFLLRMPVAFAMLLIGVVGFAYLTAPKAALGLLAGDIFERFTSYPLTVVPMFILMGSFSFASGISRRLYETAYAWAGHLRGGLPCGRGCRRIMEADDGRSESGPCALHR